MELADTLVDDYDVIEFLPLLAERMRRASGGGRGGDVLFDAHGRPADLGIVKHAVGELIEAQTEDGPCLVAAVTGA